MPRILGFGAIFSVVLTTFEYTGGSLRGGESRASYPDEYERKEFLRLNRRRPIEETIAQLGEGRGKFRDGLFQQFSIRPLKETVTNVVFYNRNQAPRLRGAKT